MFRRVYSAFWGPRTDDVMRAACLTLRAQHGVVTLAAIPTLLTDPAYRQRVTAAVTDPVLSGFWDWYGELTDASRSQVISPLMNKLRGFLLRPFVRDALTAGPSTVDMNQILDSGICLVRIPRAPSARRPPASSDPSPSPPPGRRRHARPAPRRPERQPRTGSRSPARRQ